MAASKEQNSLLQISKPFLQAQKIKQKKSDSIFGKISRDWIRFFLYCFKNIVIKLFDRWKLIEFWT